MKKPGTELGVFLHEVGAHIGIEGLTARSG